MRPGSGVTLAFPFLVPLFYQVCVQVPTRQPRSLSSELTGNCSLLTPDLRPWAQVYFSNLGKDWACTGLGQLQGLSWGLQEEVPACGRCGGTQGPGGGRLAFAPPEGNQGKLSEGWPGGEPGSHLTLSSSVWTF